MTREELEKTRKVKGIAIAYGQALKAVDALSREVSGLSKRLSDTKSALDVRLTPLDKLSKDYERVCADRDRLIGEIRKLREKLRIT